MFLVFNELSFREYKHDAVLLETFVGMGKVFSKAKNIGYDHILFPQNIGNMKVTRDKSFMEWISSVHTSEKNKIFSLVQRRPFIEDKIGDKENLVWSYFFRSEDLGMNEYCEGLATADILGFPSISLKHHPCWMEEYIQIWKEEESVFIPRNVLNISNESSLMGASFQSYTEKTKEVSLIKTLLQPEQKKITLRDDHGKDKLKKFSDKLVRSDYVEEIVNSIDFQPKTSRFIGKVYANGIIDIIMHWEDAGYGIAVKTTGRNHKETSAIAQILREKFDE